MTFDLEVNSLIQDEFREDIDFCKLQNVHYVPKDIIGYFEPEMINSDLSFLHHVTALRNNNVSASIVMVSF